ncbi:hypothetical protein BKA57DRAFT_451253 [Linnemannia elongata]|nr:hypothetical protein BKA57DRAFT_451253 [Linnemannia elongata]
MVPPLFLLLSFSSFNCLSSISLSSWTCTASRMPGQRIKYDRDRRMRPKKTVGQELIVEKEKKKIDAVAKIVASAKRDRSSKVRAVVSVPWRVKKGDRGRRHT